MRPGGGGGIIMNCFFHHGVRLTTKTTFIYLFFSLLI